MKKISHMAMFDFDTHKMKTLCGKKMDLMLPNMRKDGTWEVLYMDTSKSYIAEAIENPSGFCKDCLGELRGEVLATHIGIL